MPKDLVIGGVVMRTAQDVLDNYTPESERVPSEVWHTVRPLAVRAVSKSTYRAPTSVHFALRITARFLAWALEQDLPLDPEVMFTPQRVEQYIAEGEGTSSPHSQGNYRAALTNVGRAITKRAPWEPDRTQYTKHVRLAPPYTETEMAGYWDAVEQQSEKGAHILRSLLVLAHGGGLKVPELMDIAARDIFFLAGAPVSSIKVAERIAPVLTQYTEELRALCAARPEGPIIGTQKKKSNDTFANFRKAIKTRADVGRVIPGAPRPTPHPPLPRQKSAGANFCRGIPRLRRGHTPEGVRCRGRNCRLRSHPESGLAPYLPTRSEPPFGAPPPA